MTVRNCSGQIVICPLRNICKDLDLTRYYSLVTLKALPGSILQLSPPCVKEGGGPH